MLLANIQTDRPVLAQRLVGKSKYPEGSGVDERARKDRHTAGWIVRRARNAARDVECWNDCQTDCGRRKSDPLRQRSASRDDAGTLGAAFERVADDVPGD